MLKKVLLISLTFLLFSCGTTKIDSDSTSKNGENQNTQKTETKKETGKIKLLFAGDVMAHEENFLPGKFDRIWKYVSSKIQEADLAFCNLESPVMDSKGWRAYPSFNMHTDYVEEAIKAGFDVFSLANNHTNDQYLKGINSTRNYFKQKRDNNEEIWAAGLREKANAPLTYQLIEKKSKDGSKWKILFVAITELLNKNDYSEYIDYYPSTTTARKKLKNELKKLQTENEYDLFVVSMHNDEPEYILKPSTDHKNFCNQLINECKVDIVWSNHPHVVQDWEKVESTDGRNAFIMYANGNTIAGQRRTPHFENPANSFDYRGEGIFMEMDFEKNKDGKIEIKKYEPHLITVMIASEGRYVIRFLTNEFLDILDEAEYLKWKNYLSERKRLMEAYLPKLKSN